MLEKPDKPWHRIQLHSQFFFQRSLVCKLAVTEGRKERQDIIALAMRMQIDLEEISLYTQSRRGLLHRDKLNLPT